MRVLSLDPSGNYGSEGSGTTGWAYFDGDNLVDFDVIKASDYESQEEYWSAIWDVVYHFCTNGVQRFPLVIESFKLFGHKAKQQSWSAMETSQLIGYLRMKCWEQDIPIYFQDPADKARVTDPILTRMGVFEKRGNKYYCQGKPTNLHARDAIRHGIYFNRYGRAKVNG